jgi:hypothetical protein
MSSCAEVMVLSQNKQNRRHTWAELFSTATIWEHRSHSHSHSHLLCLGGPPTPQGEVRVEQASCQPWQEGTHTLPCCWRAEWNMSVSVPGKHKPVTPVHRDPVCTESLMMPSRDAYQCGHWRCPFLVWVGWGGLHTFPVMASRPFLLCFFLVPSSET